MDNTVDLNDANPSKIQTIFTIGHSNLDLERFIKSLLQVCASVHPGEAWLHVRRRNRYENRTPGRPVLRAGRLSTNLLSRYGGPFDMAVVVNFGTPGPLKRTPQSEDYLFDLSKIRAIGAPAAEKILEASGPEG